MSTDKIILLLLSIFLFGSCAAIFTPNVITDESDLPEKIDVSGVDSIIIEWDSYSDPDSSYRDGFLIYYKETGSNDWIFIDEVSGEYLEYEFDLSSLSGGNYVFGLSYLDRGGNESEIHSSLDNTAKPSNGWFLYLE